MTQELKPFTGAAQCPMCAHRDVAVDYCGRVLETSRRKASCRGNEVVDNHLHRICRRCGYEWLELTWDATLAMPGVMPAEVDETA
jgi:hypothetical protein